MIKLAHFSFFFMAEDYGGSVPGLQLKPTSPLVPQILSSLKLGNYSKNFSFSPTSSFSPVQWIILISIQICDYFFLFRKSKAKQTNKQPFSRDHFLYRTTLFLSFSLKKKPRVSHIHSNFPPLILSCTLFIRLLFVPLY